MHNIQWKYIENQRKSTGKWPEVAQQFTAEQSGSKQLKAAQSSSKQLKGAQSSSKQLKAAQSSSKQLKAAQSTSKQLKAAQSSSKQLQAAQSASCILIVLLVTVVLLVSVFRATPSPERSEGRARQKWKNQWMYESMHYVVVVVVAVVVVVVLVVVIIVVVVVVLIGWIESTDSGCMRKIQVRRGGGSFHCSALPVPCQERFLNCA